MGSKGGHWVCPKCGDVVYKKEDVELLNFCNTCDVDLINLNTTMNQWAEMSKESREIWERRIEVKVRSNPLFSQKAFDARIEREKMIAYANVRMYFICPRCADITTKKRSDTLPYVCDMCHYNLIGLNMSVSALKVEDRSDWFEEKVDDIKNNSLFSKKAYKARLSMESGERKAQAMQTAREIMQRDKDHPTCPYCGHDKFQMVARKWSVLTGLLTNKVDRVCERCKRKF